MTRPARTKLQPIRWGEEEDALVAAARAAMPGATEETSIAAVVRWALRVAPEASERARRRAAEKSTPTP